MIGNALGISVGATGMQWTRNIFGFLRIFFILTYNLYSVLSFYVHSVFAKLQCGEATGSDAFHAVCVRSH
jgi:hypothetical protein